ncbi:MAG: hypothetical protein BWY49_00630 [Candidatus Omnitrophica bacterium ADurb.Bin314]|nr:MAG: hypothetical protein BWY49_00630 [Candidatus Omnitrophica bacterium ADurb.Bin314]
METDEITSEHPLENLFLPRADPERLGVGPRDMPKKGDLRVGPFFLNHPRQQREVIVLNEKHRWLIPKLLQKGVRKFPINLLIVVPVLDPENGANMADMAERPEPFVGKTIVVAFLFFRSEPHPFQREGRLPGRDPDLIALIHHLAVGVPRTVSKPKSSSRLHHGIESRDHTACRRDAFDLVPILLVNVRLAVGDHVKLLVVKFGLEIILEALFGPDRSLGIHEPGLFHKVQARRLKARHHMTDPVKQFLDLPLMGIHPSPPGRLIPEAFLDHGSDPGDRPRHVPADHKKGNDREDCRKNGERDRRIPPKLAGLDHDEAPVMDKT